VLALAAGSWLFVAGSAHSQNTAPSSQPTVIGWEGKVEVSRLGTSPWDPARTNQILQAGDLLRTGERSRATIQLSPGTTKRLGEQSLLRVPTDPGKRGVLNLLKGVLYLFHRDKPGEFPVETPTGYAAVLGTEFVVSVDERDGTTRLDLIDGQVELTNQFGKLQLSSGEAGLIERGQGPRRTAAINAVRVVQWCLYYPGVLHLNELDLSAEEKTVLQPSLAAYASGDLLQALAGYPIGRQPETEPEKIYLATLLLSVGQVEEAEKFLSSISSAGNPGRLAASLRQVISAVTLQTPVVPAALHDPALATEWLAASYAEQAQSRLIDALAAARRAVEQAPEFAFGWGRVAELEFSFGRIGPAQVALERSLSLAPRNAQAVALNGFLLAARNRFTEAEAEFDRAIALDSALGNAWLGRGLVRIRHSRSEEGRQDLLVAATVEPQRAALRSYLGKAFAQGGDAERAGRELALAQKLDPLDPTPWLYSALLHQERNRINEAIRDLEQSQELNANRAVYRSSLLLDQDQAVRGANLATIYQDAGMTDVAAREAARAVNADYANYSSHLFLANTYDALRDPNQVNVRYETPWLSEYLVANLLAPVGAGTLSPMVSQQEYSKLFERDRVGLVSSTEYLSNGDWTQGGAVYGVAGNSGFALEEFYRSRNGQRRNNDLEQLSLSLQFKQQLTPADGVYFQAVYYNAEGGDLVQRYDPASANVDVRVKETQDPLLLAGYHHEWGPGSHTLFLAGRLTDTLHVGTTNQRTLFLDTAFLPGTIQPILIEQAYRSELEIYTGEAQQIWQGGDHTVIAGARFQAGDMDARNQPGEVQGFPSGFVPAQPQMVDEDFARASAYLYEQWQVIPVLRLIGGVSYDWLKAPVNFRFAPLSQGEETTDQVSPKAGLIFTPHRTTTLRAAYAQSLGGVSFDQSFALEPTQVAGFNQAWRSLIPESVAGANSGATFETWGLALDEKFDTGTYLGLSLELLKSKVDRTVGIYESFSFGVVTPGDTREKLDYEERSLVFTANQLIGREWTLGGRYRVSQAVLHDDLVEIPTTATPIGNFQASQRTESVLHHVDLYALYTHPSGFFGMAESAWYAQSNQGYSPDRPGDDFWQFNVYVGYRFPRRRAEIKLGLLNITDQDYRLNPLNLTTELLRDRTLMASVRFNF
jgi:tetratricopeptide (TPR) repeat protein